MYEQNKTARSRGTDSAKVIEEKILCANTITPSPKDTKYWG